MNTATDIVQDSDGFIWIGTQSGLNRFDGYEVEQYFRTNNPGSLPHEHIRALLVDSKDQLWVGTLDGLVIFETSSQSFRSIRIGSEIRGHRVRTLLEDRQGTVWVGTSKGLYFGSEEKLVSVAEDYEIGKGRFGIVTGLFEDAFGRIWVGTASNGVFVLLQNGQVENVAGWVSSFPMSNAPSEIRHFWEDDSGTVWASSMDMGVIHLDFALKQISSLDGTKSYDVYSVFEGRNGESWIGGRGGLVKWDGKLRRLRSTARNRIDFEVAMVSGFLRDDSGNVWISTTGGGVARFSERTSSAASYRPTYLFPSQPISDFVSSMAESASGELMIGTLTGLIRWNASARTFIRDSVMNTEISDQRVSAIEYIDGRTWVGTVNGGLNLYDGDELVNTFVHDPANQDSIGDNGVVDIFVDSKNRIWISHYGAGLSLYLGGNRFKRFPLLTSDTSTPRVLCSEIAEDSRGNLWIATYGGGPLILDPETSEISHIQGASVEQVANMYAVKISGDSVWLGTEVGLYQYDLVTNEVSLVTPNYHGPVYAIETVGNQIWIGTRKGVSLIERGTVTDFNVSHGLLSGDYNSLASTKLKNGKLVFGGTLGFSILDPDAMSLNRYKPPIVATGIKVNGDTSTINNLSSLAFSDSTISIKFSALDYTFPEKNQYKYKLEGFDQDWIDNGTDRDITYTNLDPGSYTLRVMGSNSDGLWSDKQLTIPIVVQPPPWATWWARTVYVAFALFLIYYLVQLNAQRQKREAEDRYSKRLELYLLSLDEASDFVFNADQDGRVLFANSTTRALLDKGLSEVIGYPMLDVLFSDESNAQKAKKDLEESGFHRTEIKRVEGIDGRILEVTISKSEQPDEDVAYVGVARDVTEQSTERNELRADNKKLTRELQEISNRLKAKIDESINTNRDLARSANEKEHLLRGIHDRVSENFQMLTSLLNIQMNKTSETEVIQTLEDNQQRINALALVHENLHDSQELRGVRMDSYLNMLATGIYRRFQPDGINIRFEQDVDDIVLDLSQAVPCGLIVNELLSNALEHAFTENKRTPGKVSLSVTRSAHNCILTVSDNGKGLPVDFNIEAGNNMGIEITSILADQLGGGLRLIGGAGTTFEVSFPITSMY